MRVRREERQDSLGLIGYRFAATGPSGALGETLAGMP